ncbi:uncharacterized protein LTHEOB_5988 [Lasiodiplodia theobromae]|uniref:uncharacterized protein n=1 Tax=Lasiodiplodia theobromae TaxID=45133 RepID=UPI0015C34184|nr:uncharacterized protein LTHEOB_5988 [Lasiodiplodia theobromae]KAF4544418.1 hypothetical protein LTHEOB_5988 [Lasiodiplodia theobromae]
MYFPTIITIFAALTPFALADCCYKVNGRCRDGTVGTPYCGKGGCNWLGCDCAGGCRNTRSRVMERQAADAETTDAFNKASGGTGKLTEPQFAAFVGVPADDPTVTQLFKEHDKNNDGVVTIDEIGG